ncbi:sialate O-acetylesterase, partial [uncultured Gimesia sp.]|uniref:sialate O-acetylesterase n=1 Tax=uncultured Gimesia sp. TaxID=1678688 RepID=UPI0026322731
MKSSLYIPLEYQKMKIKLIQSVTLFIGMLVVSGSLPGEEKVIQLPDKEKFHIYLLMGQSNMAGRGKVVPATNVPHPRVLKLDKKGDWVPATDPLHFDKPTIAGVGPGSAFGPAMADANSEVTIGLIPAAFG